LGNGNEGQVIFGFQSFKFHVIEQVAGSPVNFVEQQPVQFGAVFLGVGNQFLEGFSFVTLAGGFGYAKELDDFAARLRGVPAQGILLDFKTEAFPLLLTAANSG
jgi:hypothetical protein